MSSHSVQVVSFGDDFFYSNDPLKAPGPSNAPNGSQLTAWTWTDAQVTTIKINEDDTDGRTTFDIAYYTHGFENASDQILEEEATIGDLTLAAGTRVAIGAKGKWVTTTKLDDFGNVETDATGTPIQLKYLLTYLTDGSNGSQYSPPLNDGHSYVVIPVDHKVPFQADMTLSTFEERFLQAEDYGLEYPPTPVCFTPGTFIDTPNGPRLVEEIIAGTPVTTRDRGDQPVVWVGRQYISAGGLDQQPNLRPIRIQAGALGPNRPKREMLLSPQHRVLARGDIVRRMFDETEVLVPAKHLTALEGVDAVSTSEGITYLHLLLEQHELLCADGIWAESLLTGPEALKGMAPAAYREITGIFPHLREITERPSAARPLISGKRGRRLAERCAKNGKAFQMS